MFCRFSLVLRHQCKQYSPYTGHPAYYGFSLHFDCGLRLTNSQLGAYLTRSCEMHAVIVFFLGPAPALCTVGETRNPFAKAALHNRHRHGLDW